jgi:hypothetical protein
MVRYLTVEFFRGRHKKPRRKSADLNREIRAAGGVWKQSEMIRQSA